MQMELKSLSVVVIIIYYLIIVIRELETLRKMRY